MRSSNCFNEVSWTGVSAHRSERQLLFWIGYSSNPSKVAWASCLTVSTLRRSSCACTSLACLAFCEAWYFASAAFICAVGALSSMAFCRASASGLGVPPKPPRRPPPLLALRRYCRRGCRGQTAGPCRRRTTSRRASITFWTSGWTAFHSVSLVKPSCSWTLSIMRCCICAGSKLPPPPPPPPPPLSFWAETLPALNIRAAAIPHIANNCLLSSNFSSHSWIVVLIFCFVTGRHTHAARQLRIHLHAMNIPARKRRFTWETEERAAQLLLNSFPRRADFAHASLRVAGDCPLACSPYS